jgi:hypothetical protein
VIVALLRRSLSVVSRGMLRIGLCGALCLAGCGQTSSSRSSGALAPTAPDGGTPAVRSGGSSQGVTQSRKDIMLPGTQAQQTQPTITPRRGGAITVFTLHLTSRVELGRHGSRMALYRITLAGPPAPGCIPEATPIVRSGSIGQRLEVVLHPPSTWWCPGDYSATITLEQGPNCRASQRCPEFRSESLVVGRVTWSVAKTPKPV